jgi:hypothetical protein
MEKEILIQELEKIKTYYFDKGDYVSYNQVGRAIDVAEDYYFDINYKSESKNPMKKMTKKDLQNYIISEATKLYKIEVLKERKESIDKELNMLSEGEILNEGWKDWLVAGLLVATAAGGYYKFNKSEIDKEHARTELYNKIKPAADKTSSSERSDILWKLKDLGVLNVSFWPKTNSPSSTQVHMDYINKNMQNASSDEIEAYLNKNNAWDAASDSINVETVVAQHPELFGISNNGKLVLAVK